MIKKFTAVTLMMILIFRSVSITVYAAFSPVVSASWHSNFSKVELVDKAEALDDEPVLTGSLFTPSDMESSDEEVDFTGNEESVDDQDSVVPDTTAYDGELAATTDDQLTVDGTDALDEAVYGTWDKNVPVDDTTAETDDPGTDENSDIEAAIKE